MLATFHCTWPATNSESISGKMWCQGALQRQLYHENCGKGVCLCGGVEFIYSVYSTPALLLCEDYVSVGVGWVAFSFLRLKCLTEGAVSVVSQLNSADFLAMLFTGHPSSVSDCFSLANMDKGKHAHAHMYAHRVDTRTCAHTHTHIHVHTHAITSCGQGSR